MVTPFVGVWIETHTHRFYRTRQVRSHPSWVCGLKLQTAQESYHNQESHPSWVCGLKLHYAVSCDYVDESHPSWVCGLKPYSALWKYFDSQSHPSWVCGLKHNEQLNDMDKKSHTLRGCVD